MKRFGLFLGTLVTVAAIANAQEAPPTPVAEVGLNYSLFHANSSQDARQITSNGGSGTFIYNVNHTLGLVADFGGYHNGSAHGPFESDTTFSYLFGPRFNWRHSRMNPYVQFLFGGARVSAETNLAETGTIVTSDHNGFATAAGGGLDFNLTHHIVLKPIQIEYVMTQVPSFVTDRNSFQNNVRYSAGVVFTFGEK